MSDIKLRATPAARFLSKQNNIDLSLLKLELMVRF